MSNLTQLREPIQLAMQHGEVPGLAMALARRGSVEIATFGVREHGNPDPVTAETIFPAQSITKPVVAYAILKLMERGVLDLDTPLSEYLPEPYLPDQPDALSITVRHVLSHQVGFPNWRPRGEELRMKWPAGTRYSYSGEGYLYLQRVVEHITGQAWDAYLRDHLFEPLGMHSS